MKILAIKTTERIRVRLCIALGIVNWVCILLSLLLIGIGAYVKLSVAEYMLLVEDYDSDTLPFLMIGVGLFSLILNAGAGFLFFLSNDPAKRSMLRPFYFVYIALAIVVAGVVMAGGAMCFSHIGHLSESFQNGITASMQMYKNAQHKKKEIDLLQMNYQCCGNDFYDDWFSIDWIAESYRADFDDDWDSEPMHDHVPFSCCSAEVPRPCVHADVQDNYAHVNYDFKTSLTLNEIGCREALMNFFGDDILVPSGCITMAIFFLQVGLIFLSRFLQTSITSALAKGSPTIESEAYFIQIGSTLAMPDAAGQDNLFIPPGTYPMEEQESAGDPMDITDHWDDDFNNTAVEPERRASGRSSVKARSGGFDDTYQTVPVQSGSEIERRRSSGRSSVRSRISSHSLRKHSGELQEPIEPQQAP